MASYIPAPKWVFSACFLALSWDGGLWLPFSFTQKPGFLRNTAPTDDWFAPPAFSPLMGEKLSGHGLVPAVPLIVLEGNIPCGLLFSQGCLYFPVPSRWISWAVADHGFQRRSLVSLVFSQLVTPTAPFFSRSWRFFAPVFGPEILITWSIIMCSPLFSSGLSPPSAVGGSGQ